MTLVKIYYGPYLLHGVIRHRIQKLKGLIEKLVEYGYEVQIEKVDLLNRLAIEMCNRQIFMCDIRHLKFNMECDDDALCKKIVDVVHEARIRINATLSSMMLI